MVEMPQSASPKFGERRRVGHLYFRYGFGVDATEGAAAGGAFGMSAFGEDSFFAASVL
jgi:hypothetical protein